jgi:enoyl-CoA hydratase/carnithine racemase
MTPTDADTESAPVKVLDIPLARDLVAVELRMNRPESLNALNWSMARLMLCALDEIEQRPEVRAVVLTGAGTSFCSGGDLKGYRSLQQDPVAFPAFVRDFHQVLLRFRGLAMPVLALVNGYATAGGLELLLGVDIVIAEESAKIGDCHINYGQMGGGGTLSLLSRLVGIRRATDLIFSGRTLSAAEAHAWGLITSVVEDGTLRGTGLAQLEKLATRSAPALAAAKSVMNRIWADAVPLEAALELEQQANAFYCLTSEDATVGLRQFAEKQRPSFPGLRQIAVPRTPASRPKGDDR